MEKSAVRMGWGCARLGVGGTPANTSLTNTAAALKHHAVERGKQTEEHEVNAKKFLTVAWEMQLETETLNRAFPLIPIAREQFTHMLARPHAQVRVGSGPRLTAAGRGRRQGARGVLFWWSWPRDKLLQAVALPTAQGSPTSAPSPLGAARCGPEEHTGVMAALCHWKRRRA